MMVTNKTILTTKSFFCTHNHLSCVSASAARPAAGLTAHAHVPAPAAATRGDDPAERAAGGADADPAGRHQDSTAGAPRH